jgi:hypothetical protein
VSRGNGLTTLSRYHPPLLKPLQNVPPRPVTVWRANFYRVDHDAGKRTQWEWAPVGPSFHEYQKFGDLVFAER